MRDRSFAPDLTTYTTVISALGSHGDVVGAQRIYSEIREQGLDPDMRLYNAMLEALSKGADGRTLASFFAEMRQYGFRPDVRTFSIMLKDAYARGDYDLAVTFLAEIKRENILPDVELCNALIRVGSRAEGGRALVSEVIALMRRHRLEADATTHHTLIAAYALLGEAQLALATFEDMKQRVRRLTASPTRSICYCTTFIARGICELHPGLSWSEANVLSLGLPAHAKGIHQSAGGVPRSRRRRACDANLSPSRERRHAARRGLPACAARGAADAARSYAAGEVRPAAAQGGRRTAWRPQVVGAARCARRAEGGRQRAKRGAGCQEGRRACQRAAGPGRGGEVLFRSGAAVAREDEEGGGGGGGGGRLHRRRR